MKDGMKTLFDQFLKEQVHIGARIIKDSGYSWIEERKSVYQFYRQKFNPRVLRHLTPHDFHHFLTFRGNQSWTNLPRACSQLTDDMTKLREILRHLQDKSIRVEDRINDVLAKGRLHSKGCGKNLATGMLHIFDWSQYGVWNNLSEDVIKKLELMPQLPVKNPGQIYVLFNNVLCDIAKDLDIDLVSLDGFLYWLDDTKKIDTLLTPGQMLIEKSRGRKPYHVAKTVREVVIDDQLIRDIFVKIERRERGDNYFDWDNKPIKELGVAQILLESLVRQNIPFYAPQSSNLQPPDVIAEDSNGSPVGVEITELTDSKVVRQRLKNKIDWFDWTQEEFIEAIEAIIGHKDQRGFGGGPYAKKVLIIFTDEKMVTFQEYGQSIVEKTFPKTQQLTDIYLLFSYDPGLKYCPVIPLKLNNE